MAVGQGEVLEGDADRHRQQKRYPWRGDYAACCGSSMRNAQHRRLPTSHDVLAVDVTALSGTGPHVQAGATLQAGWTYAKPSQGKAEWKLRHPLPRMVVAARAGGHVISVHADGETGIDALEPALLALGATLTTAQGRNTMANDLPRGCRGRFSPRSAQKRRRQWHPATAWAAQRIAGTVKIPAGATMLVRQPLLANLGQLDALAPRRARLRKSTTRLEPRS